MVVCPTVFSENYRCRIDLIDMQIDGERKFILMYQDHLTKSAILHVLKRKCTCVVACHLLDIFTLFGSLNILQSDNGREFANEVVAEVCHVWTKVKIVHGKSSHSQNQGSAERANQE